MALCGLLCDACLSVASSYFLRGGVRSGVGVERRGRVGARMDEMREEDELVCKFLQKGLAGRLHAAHGSLTSPLAHFKSSKVLVVNNYNFRLLRAVARQHLQATPALPLQGSSRPP